MQDTPDDTFISYIDEFLDDWNEQWRASSSSITEYTFERVKRSRVYQCAGPDDSPGRWLSDHYKSRSWNQEWTERLWGYFISFALRGKLDKSSGLWNKLHEQKLKKAMLKAKEAAAAALADPEVAVANPKKAANKIARAPARYVML